MTWSRPASAAARRRRSIESDPGRPLKHGSGPRRLATTLVAALLLGIPQVGHAQYSLSAPSGDELSFERDSLLSMRDRSRALRQNLEEDPLVLYSRLFGQAVEAGAAERALPWNAIDVVTDSLASIMTPGNLREAERAYVNYAVLRMRAVRGDPDVSCDELMDRELEAVRGFADGWIVARTLFGGPEFEPLDELAFAAAAGVLPGFVADNADPHLGGCLAVWSAANEEAIEAYRVWQTERFRGGR